MSGDSARAGNGLLVGLYYAKIGEALRGVAHFLKEGQPMRRATQFSRWEAIRQGEVDRGVFLVRREPEQRTAQIRDGDPSGRNPFTYWCVSILIREWDCKEKVEMGDP